MNDIFISKKDEDCEVQKKLALKKVQQRVVLNLLIYVRIADLKWESDTVCPVIIGTLT